MTWAALLVVLITPPPGAWTGRLVPALTMQQFPDMRSCGAAREALIARVAPLIAPAEIAAWCWPVGG